MTDNFFDQFDTAPAGAPSGGNFFDQFHPPAAQPSAGLWDQIKSIPGGMVQGIANAASAGGAAAHTEMGQPVTVPDAGQTAQILEKNVTGQLPSNGTYGRALGEGIGNPASWVGVPGARQALGIAGSALGGQLGGDLGGTTGRLIGALGGGMAGAARAPAAAAESAVIPTAAELKAAAQAGYKSPDVAAVAIKPEAVTNLAASIENDLLKQGFRPTAKSAGDTFGEIRDLRVPQGVESVSVADLDTARQALGNLAKEKDAIGQPTAEAAAAGRAISKIDDFLPNLDQSDLLAGDASKANAILGEARANYKAYKQSSLVDTKADNAQLQAASTYGGGNINNATRQAFRPMLKNNAAGASGFSPEALDQLNQVVTGGPVGNIARQLGRLAPTGPVNMGIHLGAALGTGGATIPLAIGAYGAKKIGEGITASEVAKLGQIIRSQSPLYASRAAQATPPATPSMGGLSPSQLALLRSTLLSSQQFPGVSR